ncbi:hypothetical protein RND81_05G012300 [Saponaria officinalis]|uniref:DUF7138 domain-containing protein n=1 Tax=Saponaria officinalis TaxID=3572 RepID=A0AAW1KSS8_SAPOF
MMMIMDDGDQTTVNPTTTTTTVEVPVIFYDGEKEIDLNKVQIVPGMTFKMLQSTLSNKIGISPNHITIYFDRSNRVNHQHHRRRHPVTSKFDFSAVENGGCFFWVVLKRGRRNRRRRNSKNDVVENCQQFVLLRRGINDNNNININNINDCWEYLDYVNRLRMIDQIEREKERYLMSLNLNSNVYNELSGYNHHNYTNNNSNYNNNNYHYDYNNSNYSDDYYYSDEIASCSSSTGGASSERVFCDVCYNSSGGDTVPFHWCKNDVVVTTRTRSLVGPIAPPLKNGLRG